MCTLLKVDENKGGKMDLIIANAKIVTIDSKNRTTEALAIKDGVFRIVGTNDEALALRGPTTQVLDAKGRVVLPGFIEPHCHLFDRVIAHLAVDTRTPPNHSIEDIVARIRTKAKETPKGEWIIGGRYEALLLKEKRFINRYDLDKATREHPVFVRALSGMIAVANSKALEVAGVTRETPDPLGGKIGRDPQTGEPDGQLYQYAGYQVVMKHLKSLPWEMIRPGIVKAQNEFLRQGITSFHEPKLGHFGLLTDVDTLKSYQRAAREEILKMRVYIMIFYNLLKELKFALESGLGDHRIKIGGASILEDGHFQGHTAAVHEPYLGTANDRGFLVYTQQQLNEIVLDLHSQGYQVLIHGNGDRAIETTLESFEKALQAFPRKNARHRIENCHMSRPDHLQRMKHLDITPSYSISDIYIRGDRYAEEVMGREQAQRICPVASALKAGLKPVLHSETALISPLLSIQTAVDRRTSGGQVLGKEEQISVMEAIRMVTVNAARLSFEEHLKGTIEVGKLGDVVVLDRDNIETPLYQAPKVGKLNQETLGDVPVAATVVGGKVVFSTSELSLG